MRRMFLFASFAMTCLLVLSCRTGSRITDEPNENVREPIRERIGYLEHRGQRYSVTALMDASYRQNSNDPFVRGFEPKRELSSPWAGLDPPEPPEYYITESSLPPPWK